MTPLVIFGTGLIAEVADFYFRTDSAYDVVAFTNAEKFIEADTFLNRPLIAFEKLAEQYGPDTCQIFIALGYKKTNQIRQQRYGDAKQSGYQCASYVSSRAMCYGESIGDNCFILENNVIQPFVKIGDNVTLWSGNHIGHHTTIGDHCFVSSHVVISGGCRIDENCFLGVNSTLRDNIQLGKFTVVSAGASVMDSCEERSVIVAPRSTTRVIKKDVI